MLSNIDNRLRLARLTILMVAGLAGAWLLLDGEASSSTRIPIHRFQKQERPPKMKAAVTDDKDFEKYARAVMTENCLSCHNDRKASGSLNLAPFLDSSSLETRR